MTKPWVVLKFGGTSVAGRRQWEAIAGLLRERRDAGEQALVVCSALAGVTDALEGLADGEAGVTVEGIVQRHRDFALDLRIDADDLLVTFEARLRERVAAWREDAHPAHRAGLLAEGEFLCTRLGHRFLARSNPLDWLDATTVLPALPEPDPDSSRAWLSARSDAVQDPALQAALAESPGEVITQGFVARAPDGRPALLGRGGSDTSAALLAGRLDARRVEIWTDVAGLYSADPRVEPGARLLESLGYDEALEMAAGGARVIHGRSIRAAAATGVPILIRSLEHPEQSGTRIANGMESTRQGIRAVTSLPDMVVLLLENLDTRQQVGFLAGVFEAIARRGLSVDQVATSETTTTVAIDRAANRLDDAGLEALATELKSQCRVAVFRDCSCVNLVGRGARTGLARLGPMRSFFERHPLYMLSQSANDLSLSLLVPAGTAPELMRLLHRHLVAEP